MEMFPPHRPVEKVEGFRLIHRHRKWQLGKTAGLRTETPIQDIGGFAQRLLSCGPAAQHKLQSLWLVNVALGKSLDCPREPRMA